MMRAALALSLFLVGPWVPIEQARAQSLGANMVILPIDAETQANFDRATTYWNTRAPCDTILISVDQEYVAPNAAMAGGCIIWIGDYYLSTSASRRCAIVVHEWGHLIGRHDGGGQIADPLNVMGSDAMPPSCTALDPPSPSVAVPPVSPPATPTDTTGLNAADVAAYVRWAKRRNARVGCTANANMKRHRATRIVARRKCVRRYGRIGARPKASGLVERR